MPVTDAAVNAAIPTDGTQPSRSLTQALLKAIRGAELVVANPASPYSWDVGASPVLRITGLNHALTITATGGTDGQSAALTIVQDATGNRTVTFGSGFRGGGTWTDAGNAEATFSYRRSSGSLSLAGGGGGASGAAPVGGVDDVIYPGDANTTVDGTQGRRVLYEYGTTLTGTAKTVSLGAGAGVQTFDMVIVYRTAGGVGLSVTGLYSAGTGTKALNVADSFLIAIYDGPTNKWRVAAYYTGPAVAAESLSPFSNATGSQAAAASGNSWKLTGNVTAVPIANGWNALYVNLTAGNISITPAAGDCVVVETGATAASVSLAANKAATVIGDGSNLLVFGDVV